MILVLDVTDLIKVEDKVNTYRLKEAQEKDIEMALSQGEKEIIVLLNKADLICGSEQNEKGAPKVQLSNGMIIRASLVSFACPDTSKNIDLVSLKLKKVVSDQGLARSSELISDPNAADNFLVTRHRHRVLLEQTASCLDNFL